MTITGIDPAPSSATYIYSGTHKRLRVSELHLYLERLIATKDGVLLCWDAPLTGPHSPNTDTYREGDFTQRRIESFFNRQETDFKTPRGISVRGYGGCPHWTITRHLFGLPRVGQWDKALKDLPFTLVDDQTVLQNDGKFIVEVHPGLAAWLWCSFGSDRWTGGWEYKKDRRVLNSLWLKLSDRWRSSGLNLPNSVQEPTCDGEFDAIVAWALGALWVSRSGQVILLGNQRSGCMLLPNADGLVQRFNGILEE